MWFYNIISFNLLPLKRFFSQVKEPELVKFDLLSLKDKNIVTTGEFFPTTEEAFKEKLLMAKAKVMAKLTSETDFLICGKYPDLSLVLAAQKNGLKIIFVDKASDLFLKTEDEVQQSMNQEHTSFELIGV